jgi:hypothetical protein
MAKKKTEEVTGPKPGTVEYARQEFFEKEKAAYEERTGEKVNYELDAPLTETPIAEDAGEPPAVQSEAEAVEETGGEG